jgi:hypothetical protein
MVNCTFVLNRLTTTSLITPIGWLEAFSGDGRHRNNPEGEAVADGGPIPPGSYFIVDRKSGGLLGPARDFVLGRDEWFALYRDDGKVDDATFIGGVQRGLFRLHPLGPRRMSTGCIVLNKADDFARLRKYLLSAPLTVTQSGMHAYGMISVASLAPDSRGSGRGAMGVA